MVPDQDITWNEGKVIRNNEHGRHFLDGDEAKLEVVSPETDLDEPGAVQDHLQVSSLIRPCWPPWGLMLV